MSKDASDLINLDRILVEEVGQWGKYQFKVILICALVALKGGLVSFSYLFIIANIKTRCAIPECENTSTNLTFAPPWILDAVPASASSFDQCHRYPSITTISNTSDSCPANLFDRNSSIECEEYVYEHKNSAYYEFNLACDDWRPTLIGSAKLLGMMICLPLTGYIADRWGRRFAFALTTFNAAWIGCITYFANSYNSYILLSFGFSLFGGTSFSSGYILVVENVGPKHRVLTGVIMSTVLSVGEMLMGPIAWTEPYWKHLILIIHAPQLIFTIYFWIAPESVRWLISKGRYEESLQILKSAAKMNGNVISEKTSKAFLELKNVETKDKDGSAVWLLTEVFRHKPILLRCIVTPVWWITSILLCYGLTISSVGISGNRYLNYTATTAVQIPGYWIAMLLLDKIGRKALMIAGYWICGACQIAYIFISDGNYALSLSVYLLGTMCMGGIMTTLYVYTSELYPTQHRTSLFAFSSMMGRLGGITAPFMPGLAAQVWVHLPFALFGGMAFLSGILVLLAPETLGTTLPDTMDEASNLGKRTSSGFKLYLRKLVFKSKSYDLK